MRLPLRPAPGILRIAAGESFTFDNLGEAAELEMGSWPADQEIGHHYSVRDVIPALLERLKGGLTATFFVEGWNTEIYPEAILAIADAGHQLDSLDHKLARIAARQRGSARPSVKGAL